MENVIPKYKRPMSGIKDPVVKVKHWDDAYDAFDAKEFKKSAIEVINYINPNLLEGKNTEGDIEIIQAQGSAEIHVKITDDFFSVKAPFLKITSETNEVALLRKVAEVNFSPLTLAQITLHEKELWFEYNMPIKTSQPNKIYDLLREVCVYADDYDDLFINNYNASFYKKPNETPLPTNEADFVWNQITDVLEDYKNYTAFFKEKRWDNYQWDIIIISLLKLANMPYVQGKLRSDLGEYISNIYNSEIDFKHRVDKGVNFMKKLAAKSREEIMEDVYHAEQFISLRWRSSEQIISDRLKHHEKHVAQYEKDNSYFNQSYYLQAILLKLIYDFTLEDNYKKAIEDVLEEVSGLETDKASEKLLKVFYALLDGTLNKPKPKKSFFSKLFS